MWTYLENWIVQDGELPELEPGARLRVGLRVQCSEVCSATTFPDGVADHAGADAATPSFRYALTGIARAGKRVESFFHAPGIEPAPHFIGTQFSITVGEHVFVAMAPVDSAAVREGERVSVVCTFSIMSEYEFEELGVLDVRADWLVGGLKVELA